MAQTPLRTKSHSSSKSASRPKPKSQSQSSRIAKKGARSITPKKAVLIKQQKVTKKFSAGLTAKTELMLGAKAGHLEMLGGGKKSAKGGKGEGVKQKSKV